MLGAKQGEIGNTVCAGGNNISIRFKGLIYWQGNTLLLLLLQINRVRSIMNPQSLSQSHSWLVHSTCVCLCACACGEEDVNWPKYSPSRVTEDFRLESLILILISSGGCRFRGKKLLTHTQHSHKNTHTTDL